MARHYHLVTYEGAHRSDGGLMRGVVGFEGGRGVGLREGEGRGDEGRGDEGRGEDVEKAAR